MLSNINPTLFKFLPDITLEELAAINSRIGNLSDEQIAQFCTIYRSRRKDPQLILITCLLGLVGFAGIHRFLTDQIGMGILYFFTAGLCFIGTIVDAINYKSLSLEINSKQISETLVMLNMI